MIALADSQEEYQSHIASVRREIEQRNYWPQLVRCFAIFLGFGGCERNGNASVFSGMNRVIGNFISQKIIAGGERLRFRLRF